MICFILFSWLSFIVITPSIAQNLVPNPSFEVTGCSYGNIRTPWQRPSGSTTTPDLFNSCAFAGTNSCTNKGIPINMGGTTNPAHSGNAYAGIVDVYDFGAPNGREYIQVQLTSPLLAGVRYDIGFWILRPDYTKYATNGKGMYISTTATPQSTNQYINVTPQVVSGLVMDADNWTLVSGSYVAQGGEQWITIGNFYNDANTLTQLTGTAAGGCILINSAAYYFIDDVYVEQHILLDIKAFEAKKTLSGGSLLTWKLSNIERYKTVNIERSKDGIHFEIIGSIEHSEINQKWEDEYPLNGDNYYRLQIILEDGTIEYSATKVLNHYREKNVEVMLYPNPFHDALYMDVGAEEFIDEEKIKVELFDLLGNKIENCIVTVLDNQLVKIGFEKELSAGIYIIKGKVFHHLFKEKIIKE